jgi:hypothetical protein
MTIDTLFAVFEDFNERRDEAPPPPPDEDSIPPDEVNEIRCIAWTEGYLSACQQAVDITGDQRLTARLLTSLHDLSSTTAEAVDAASLIVADLLVNTFISVTAETWSAKLPDRVRLVADRIKPALTIAPNFVLRSAQGTEQQFTDISDLSRALETGSDAGDVTIRWQNGEATISRAAYLEELQEAIIPLTAGYADDDNTRRQT